MQPFLYSLLGAGVVVLGVFFYLLLTSMKQVAVDVRANTNAVQIMVRAAIELQKTTQSAKDDLVDLVKHLRAEFVTAVRSEELKAGRKALETLSAYGPQVSMHLIALNATMSKFTELILARGDEETSRPSLGMPGLGAIPRKPPPPQPGSEAESGAIPYDEENIAQMVEAEMLRRRGFRIEEKPGEEPAPEQIVKASS